MFTLHFRCDTLTSRDVNVFKCLVFVVPQRCTSSSGKTGICRKSFDCALRGGKAEGKCSFLNIGVCCLNDASCNHRTSFQVTTFLNRNYPSVETTALGACSLTVTPRSNTCQLRLDLHEFSLAQPNVEGVCVTDYLTVTGGSPVPRICGENAAQHIYLDVTAGTDVVVDVIMQSVNAQWNIKVTQIPCNSADKAPTGCLQYFTTTTGTISSFNFDSSATTGTFQLSDQSYGVCIEPQSGFCSITYTQTPGSEFSLTSVPGVLAPGLFPPPVVGGECTTDYIIIPGATITDTSGFIPPVPTTTDRFCGLTFPGATSSRQPYNLNFVTDGEESTAGEINNKGFQIDYTLNPCP
ncbi:CUB domain [Trinorchestia longiramus]|nr:CUB domain [Trinorchestia longiramus]